MLVVVKKKINNLIKLNSTNTFTSLINANYQELIKNIDTTTINKKTTIYKCLNTYLLTNNYTLSEQNLITYLNNYQKENNHYFTYKEINKTKKILKIILTQKLIPLIQKETIIQLEKNKIQKAIKTLKETKDNSINKYYQITETTPNYAISFLNEELNKLNNEKAFIAFNLTIVSHQKELSKILKDAKLEQITNYSLLNNIISSFNQINKLNIYNFYKEIINIEKRLNEDHIYKEMTEKSKDIYRKKITKKHNPLKYTEKLLKKEQHLGFYLFKHNHPLLCLDYSNKDIPLSSKTTINISKYFTDKESIDIFFQELENNLTPNINFTIINKNILLEEELIIYLNQKCNNLDIHSTSSNNKVTYIINLNNTEKIDLTNIKHLIGIMDHPLNKITFNKKKNKIKKGHAHLIFKTENKKKTSYNNLYQKEEAYLNKNEIFNLKISKQLPQIKNPYLQRKYLNSKYIKNISFKTNDHSNYKIYLKKYHNYIKENLHSLKKTPLKQKLAILEFLNKIIIYSILLLSIIIFNHPLLLIIELIILTFYNYKDNILLSFLKSINEYSNIPTYLTLPLTKKYYSKQQIINIITTFIFLIFSNYLGLIFLLFIPTNIILSKEKKHFRKKVSKIKNKEEYPNNNDNIPNISILSNNDLSLYIDNEEQIKTIYKNRTLKNINYQKDLSIIDLETNTPLTNQSSKITLLDNKAVIEKDYSNLLITIEVIISQIHNVEIQKITLKNNNYQDQNILIKYPTSYTEADTFIYNKYLTVKKNNSNIYITSYFLSENNKYDLTNKNKILLTTKEKIEHRKKQVLYLITITTETPNIDNIITSYNNHFNFTPLFEIRKEEKRTINHQILSYLYQINKFKLNDSRKKLLSYNNLNKDHLKKFNIPLEIPIIILDLENNSNQKLIKETISLFKYCKLNNFPLNLIILNNTDSKYLEELLYHLHKETNTLENTPDNIFILNEKELTNEEIILLYTLSYLTINASNSPSLEDYLKKLEKTLQPIKEVTYKEKKSLPVKLEKLENITSSGYFDDEKKEFYHNNRISNEIITNTISSPSSVKTITNNYGESYTYLDSNIKLSSLEEIIINNTKLQFNIVKYGLGYTTYYAKTKKLEITLTEFISYFEKIKFIHLNIKNISEDNVNISIKYSITPLLLEDFPNSNRYILTNYDSENNLITIENKLNNYFLKNTCFITCTEKIKNIDLDNPSKKTIEINKSILKNSEKELSFTLGISDLTHLTFLKEKYSNTSTINTSLAISKNYFKTILNTIKISTNNKTFDNIINNYLLYKTITEKIFQSTYKTRLKNSFNIISPLPESTKETILISATNNLNTKDIFYLIYTTYIYIKKTEENNILNELITEKDTLYDILQNKVNTITINNLDKFLYYKTIELFIEISKIYNKNINTSEYKEKLTSLKTEILNENTKNIISKTYKILLDITDNKEELICNKKLRKSFKDHEILYPYLLLKLQKYNLLFDYYQKENILNNKEFNKYSSNLYQIAIEEILGFQKKGKKLYIKPHLPSSIKEYNLTYTYLNTTYNINVIINSKENKIIINDTLEEDIDYIELKNDYKNHDITIYIKENKETS